MIGFLYGQTEYNILRNSIHIADYVKKASLYGYKSLTITDNNMHGFYKFYKLCKSYDIKPIIGIEMFIGHEVILAYAINHEGYENLLHISSEMAKHSLTVEDLLEFTKGVYFVITNESSLYEMIKLGRYSDLLSIFNEYKKNLKNVGIGIIPSNDSKEIYELAIKNNISVFPLHKTSYLEKEDKIVTEALLKIKGDNDYKIGSYLKDLSELENDFKDYPKVFEYYELFFNHVNLDILSDNIKMPIYPNKKDKTSKEFLRNLCNLGLKKRLEKKNKDIVVYQDRLNYELSIIDKMGYNDYFLIVWDFILFAKKNGILVGPGRGSAASSLVAYSIGITEIDPLEYDLLFERFLNPERITMPDIDTDFPDDKRDLVIAHVKDLYGENHVSNITAFGTFQVKSSIRDLGRIFKIDSLRLTSVIKMVSEAVDYDDLLMQVKDNKEIYNLLYIAKKIENLPRHISTHAAGIILSSERLDKVIPIQNGINGLYQSQLEAHDLEDLGLLKIDFLGISNLTTIDKVINRIGNYNNMNIYNIPLDDKKTFKLLENADTYGIFQLESDGIRRVLKKLKPSCFNDLVAILALYRPGPMDNIDDFIERKNGKEFRYIHEDIIPILKETYGIIVYQEQIMKIALKFAGYTLGEADILRRAVSKKNEDVLISEREKFVERSKNKGYLESTANEIYDYIVKFANYGFNKAHSVAYAKLSYVMAYLKANYFQTFMAKFMNNVISTKTIPTYIKYAKEHGLSFTPPNINISTLEFVEKGRSLVFPLTSIFGVGSTLAKEIINEREKAPFKSFNDYTKRVKTPSDNLSMMIFAGCFDDFESCKRALVDSIDNENAIIDRYLEDRIYNLDEYDFKYLKTKEFEAIGINLKYNIYRNINTQRTFYKAYPIKSIVQNRNIKVIASFDHIKEIVTKSGEVMMVGSITDDGSTIDVVIFPSDYSEMDFKISMEELYVISGVGSINKKSNELQLVIKTVSILK